MTEKVTAFTCRRFPLFHHDDGVYVDTTPKEITLNAWLQAQIDAGVVGVVPNRQPEKEAETKPKAAKSAKSTD